MVFFIDDFSELGGNHYGDLAMYHQRKVGVKGNGYEIGLLIPDYNSTTVAFRVFFDEKRIINDIKYKFSEQIFKIFDEPFEEQIKKEYENFKLDFNFRGLIPEIMGSCKNLPKNIWLMTQRLPIPDNDYRFAYQYKYELENRVDPTLKQMVNKLSRCYEL